MPESRRKRRIPQLRHTDTRGIGWHVSYRDPETGTPKKQRFGMVSKSEAVRAYEAWLAAWLQDDQETAASIRPGHSAKVAARTKRAEQAAVRTEVKAEPGSLVHVASGLFKYDESRVRDPNQARAAGTIAPRAMLNRRKEIKDFLAFMNERHGRGASARLRVSDLEMGDVEEYNRELVGKGFSAASVNGRIQAVKRLIDRSGRPEYGQQVLGWNWDSLDRTPGRAAERRELPTLKQLKALVEAADARGRAMIWMGIGLGFGQSDISNVRVGQIDVKGYDLRRRKTGIERFGETPPGVWKAIENYLAETPRPDGELLFVTKNGKPVVHTRSDGVLQWWQRLRESIGETKDTLGGFYTLRHLGATEYGSRSGCSIVAMKQWLGHSASSAMADRYMKPVPPEHRKLIEWVRSELTGRRHSQKQRPNQ